MKRLILATALALGISGAISASALADFRTGNSWVGTPAHQQSQMLKDHYYFFGGPLSSGHHAVTVVRCKGDLKMRHTARGFYHHMYCAAALKNTTWVATFQAWVTGKTSYRVTNLDFTH